VKRSRFRDSQILAVLRQTEVGTAVPDLTAREAREGPRGEDQAVVHTELSRSR